MESRGLEVERHVSVGMADPRGVCSSSRVIGVTGTVSAMASGRRVSSPDGDAVAWPAPAPDRVVGLTEAAGLTPETQESLLHHVHAHLDVFVDGKRVVVPAGIGINIADPGVKHFPIDGHTAHGRIDQCNEPCISQLHTHDVSGILHTESATAVDNTLGQFFTEWDVRLTKDCVDQYCTPDSADRGLRQRAQTTVRRRGRHRADRPQGDRAGHRSSTIADPEGCGLQPGLSDSGWVQSIERRIPKLHIGYFRSAIGDRQRNETSVRDCP